MGIKNQRTIYEWVNILINQIYEWVCFFFVYFSMTRYMIGVGFRNLGHTPLPQLPLSYPPPPPPPRGCIQHIFFRNEMKEKSDSHTGGHFLTLANGHLHIKMRTFFRNVLANYSQNLCGGLHEKENRVCMNHLGHMIKISAMPIYGKTLQIV